MRMSWNSATRSGAIFKNTLSARSALRLTSWPQEGAHLGQHHVVDRVVGQLGERRRDLVARLGLDRLGLDPDRAALLAVDLLDGARPAELATVRASPTEASPRAPPPTPPSKSMPRLSPRATSAPRLMSTAPARGEPSGGPDEVDVGLAVVQPAPHRVPGCAVPRRGRRACRGRRPRRRRGCRSCRRPWCPSLIGPSPRHRRAGRRGAPPPSPRATPKTGISVKSGGSRTAG